MTDRHAELGLALERVITAAREHLAAVEAADGRADDDEVWRAYVELNNASFEYDELLLDAYGEVTPWDVEAIDPDEADRQFGVLSGANGGGLTDPHPKVISVRQRRDYRVPSVGALLRLAEAARRASIPADSGPPAPVGSVGEAVLELMQAGDGSLGGLDVPELESLDGIVVVAEVTGPIQPESYEDGDGVGPFELAADEQIIDRLDEHAYIDLAEPAGEVAGGDRHGEDLRATRTDGDS